MKLFKVLLVVSILCLNLVMTAPAWADRGKFIKSPDYAEVNQAIADLVAAQNDPEQSQIPAAELQQKLANLQFQKYILETASERAQCVNQTGKTLAVYAQPKKAAASQIPTLYYLGDRQVTDDDFDCKGIYLPADTKLSLSPLEPQGQVLTEPLAIRVVAGSQLVVSANPETGALALNLPPAQTFKVGEGTWAIPTLAQADIDAQTPNAPAD